MRVFEWQMHTNARVIELNLRIFVYSTTSCHTGLRALFSSLTDDIVRCIAYTREIESGTGIVK